MAQITLRGMDPELEQDIRNWLQKKQENLASRFIEKPRWGLERERCIGVFGVHKVI